MSEAEIDFKEYLTGIKNDVQMAIDDVFSAIENIGVDVEHLKIKMSKPSKHAAGLFLDYLGWEEGEKKQNFEELYKKELRQLFKWLEYHCNKEGATQEQALKAIINGEI